MKSISNELKSINRKYQTIVTTFWTDKVNCKKLPLISFSKFSKQSSLICLCVDHVIWTGRQILKLALNVEMLIYFFYSLIEKKDETLCNFYNEIIQPFLVPKCVSQDIKKSFYIQHQFQHLTPAVQMTWFALLV